MLQQQIGTYVLSLTVCITEIYSVQFFAVLFRLFVKFSSLFPGQLIQSICA